MTGSAEYLQTPLQFLKGVGPRKAADFARVGLNTIEDLLYRFPCATKTAGGCSRSPRCAKARPSRRPAT